MLRLRLINTLFASTVLMVGSAGPATADPLVSENGDGLLVTSALTADTLCATTGMEAAARYGRIDEVLAAFASDAAAVASWVETRFGPSGPAPEPEFNPWRAEPASELVAICYYAGGDFSAPRIPGVDPYDMLVLLVPEEGVPVVDRFGHRNGETGVTAPM